MMKKIGMFLLAILAASTVLFAAGGQQNQAASSGPVKLTVEVFDRGTDGGKTDPTNNKWTEWIHEKLLKDENIDITYVAVPRWTETEALVNLFASNSAPDVCYTYSNDNIQNWADQGGLYDLTPYINTTLKDLNNFLGPDAAISGKRMIERNVDLSTGKIFSIPARRMSLARVIVWMREDWLNLLGLPAPKTTQEYYNTLAAFRDNAARIMSATGVSRVIPFITDGDRLDWGPGLIMESFIDVNLSDKERWINSIAERNLLTPGYKEGVRFLNKMYNDNLIDKDFPLYKTGDDAAPIIKSGAAGSWIGDWDTIYREPNGTLSGLKANLPNANIIPVDCITDASGKTTKTIYDAAGIFYFIPLSCKNPDAAMRYLNWMAKYENYHFIQSGYEGINHTIGADGVVKVAADPKTLNPSNDQGWMMNSNQNIDYTMIMNGLFLETQEASVRALAAGYSYPADIIQRAYNIALANGRPSVVVKPTSPLSVAGPLAQTLMDKGKVIYSELIRCAPAQFDSRWDALIADWKASGAQAVVDERRAKYPN
ncbi:MAG: extracellular solute-binding protein [Treponema sp.]|jgi:putative aldouronate transport system substrate-binding protein|nr:extracellular solute-binding protein [Treponema sp.]